MSEKRGRERGRGGYIQEWKESKVWYKRVIRVIRVIRVVRERGKKKVALRGVEEGIPTYT